MKNNNFLITLSLCALIQTSLCLGSEAQQQQSYWQQYAPTRAQNIATVAANKASNAYTTSRDYAATWVPQSVKDRVNTWSTKKKMAVASAILVALAAIYNKDVLMEWIDEILYPEQLSSPILTPKEKLKADIVNFANKEHRMGTQEDLLEYINLKFGNRPLYEQALAELKNILGSLPYAN